MPDDAALLVGLLDQQVDYLVGQGSAHRLLVLPRFLRFLYGEPRIAALVADLDEEARNELRRLGAEDASVRSRLQHLWTEHGDDIQRLLADGNSEELNAWVNMADFTATLQAAEAPSFVSRAEWPSNRPLLAFNQWANYASARPGAAPAIATIPAEIERLRPRQEHQSRALRIATECYAGAALTRLRHLADGVNPIPPTGEGDLTARLGEVIEYRQRNEWATLVHSPTRREEGRTRRQDVDNDVAQVERDAHLIQGELRQRIMLGHSRQALVRRYAARCEWFDAARLRDLAASDTRRAEANLTLDFARYLFDQGLTPLIDPTAGGLRPDVLDLSGSNVFYVEAKQYDAPNPRSTIIAAYHQVWGTWR
ncbi:MAG: hypothetical protein ACRENE_17745, partial [Polyangiaceae bacterium]